MDARQCTIFFFGCLFIWCGGIVSGPEPGGSLKYWAGVALLIVGVRLTLAVWWG